MRSLRRVALIVAPLFALTVAACGSDGNTAASSTPSTPSTTSTTLAPTTSVAPGSTAVGQPIPIGQDTTPLAGTTAPGDTAGAPTTTAGVASATTTAATATGGATTTTAAAGGPTSPPTSPPANGDDGDSEPASPNANTAFCQFESQVDDASDTADTDEAFIAALRALVPQMDQWIANAPTNDLKASATTMRDAAKQAVAANSTDPLYEDNATEALLRIRLYCGGTQ